jgi:hypothetical protein
MKSYASIKLGSLGSLSIQHSISAQADRPPGVAADEWICLEENLGIVITPPQTSGSAPPQTSGSAAASATGCLMFKHKGIWVRLDLNPSSGL